MGILLDEYVKYPMQSEPRNLKEPNSEQPLPTPVASRPVMSDGEIEMLQRFLDMGTHYLEFGGGGSTVLAMATSSIRTIFTIESDMQWIANVVTRYEQLGLSSNSDFSKTVLLHHADIGPTTSLGYPLPTTDSALFANYFSGFLAHLQHQPDVVLVDGRFRVLCVLQALLSFPTATVLVHDFWDRPHYHSVLELTDVLDRVDKLVVLKRSAKVSDELLRSWYDERAIQPDPQ